MKKINPAERWQQYAKLMRLDKPIGIMLLLWPTLGGVWIGGNGRPELQIIIIFVLGAILMRSAGCVMNDYADRDIDGQVQRTRHRPITTGQVAPREALWLAAGLALLALLLILPLNNLVLLLSLPAFLLAASYPYTKRFFSIPQAYLGVAFGFGIPMAFAAQSGVVPAVAWWLLFANVFWAIAYDTEYAMVDRDEDKHLGIKSSALLFGKHDVLAVMICYVAALGIFAAVGIALGLGAVYYVALMLAAGIAVYHYKLIRQRKREACYAAFLHNNWFGAVIFMGTMLAYL